MSQRQDVPVTAPATGIVLGDRYRLQERIASGGMGTVWAAEDQTLHRKVAVKVLNEGLSADERFTERFRREARASAGLSHPNIAGVFDFGEDEGRPYIVMELLDGETLAERLERVGRLEPDEAARIGAAVADALRHAHATGILHRDVKPANIMLTANGDVKVMDFGIAAPLEGATGLTVTGAVMGTSRYISPEQASGDRSTPASDVYSLGVVLYEALAGEPPFLRETPVATALAHMHDEPAPVADMRPGVPPALAAVVEDSLAKERERRPTPKELANRLRGGAAATDVDTTPLRPGESTAVLPVVEPTAEAPQTAPAGRTRSRRLGLNIPPGSMGTEGPRKDRRLRWIVGAGLAALILLIVGLAISTSKGVKVPRFVGLSRHDARVKAVQAGLVPTFKVVESSEARGTVVRQRPYAGASVIEGMRARLFVSSGPPPVVVSPPAPAPPPKEHHGHGEHGKGHGKHGGKD